jgi:2,3-dihydroxybenzoate decarboxylase
LAALPSRTARHKLICTQAFNLREWADMSAYQASLFVADGNGQAHANRLVDIHGERLKKMDAHNVDFCILSMTAPGIQDFVDPKEAADAARLSNDWVAGEVKKNPKRFGAFAALAMHDPKTASEELTRCVKEYGFLGALVNDNQRGGPDGETPVFYDQPEWDSFWQTCVDLDVCVRLLLQRGDPMDP